jgi:hypothetical protein
MIRGTFIWQFMLLSPDYKIIDVRAFLSVVTEHTESSITHIVGPLMTQRIGV